MEILDAAKRILDSKLDPVRFIRGKELIVDLSNAALRKLLADYEEQFNFMDPFRTVTLKDIVNEAKENYRLKFVE